ncbi:MAG: flagellar biosynthesis protein FlhF [Chloroflexi bacterium]|nr:flagellar biosynthesis protein FlhF [Chloroflexota bacterium]
MRMKKYQAPSMADALAAIRAELGPNAVILHSSEVKRGPLGLLSRPMVEVVAAVDGGATQPAGRAPGGPRSPSPRAPSPTAASVRPRTGNVATAPARSPTPFPAPSGERDLAESADSDAMHEMQTHVRELRRVLGRLMQTSDWPGVAKLSPPLVDLYERLIDQEVDGPLARELVTAIDGELSLQASADPSIVRECLAKHIRHHLRAAEPLLPQPSEPTVLFLIGPTGVGKTTTIAKLAANLGVDRARVALVTCDTFRIAAIPQLKTYADILRVPLEVAYTPDDLTQRVVDLLDRDFIIVDTPGRSQRNAEQLAELRRFVLSVPSRRTFLTVAAGARYREMLDVVARFGVIPYDALLITKVDETSTFGSIFNLSRQTERPITYLTTGQNVPNDIERATTAGLCNLLLNALYGSESRPTVALAS